MAQLGILRDAEVMRQSNYGLALASGLEMLLPTLLAWAGVLLMRLGHARIKPARDNRQDCEKR